MSEKMFLQIACCFSLLLLHNGGASTTEIQWYRTAQNTTDRISPQPSLQFGGDFPSDVTITIDRSSSYQTILGFGGAFTESAAYVFSKLNSSLQSQVLQMYFSEDGLRYNMARLPIGSTDFSLTTYSYDDIAGDINLTAFSIDHDLALIIPFIQRANATLMSWSKDTLSIVASPWSPPWWMKEIESPYCLLSCVLCQLKDEYQQAWALYFSKFIASYAAEGITIWGVTVQDEPGACPTRYEGMHFDAQSEANFVKHYLGPQLSRDHPAVKIIVYDYNKNDVVEWAQTIYSDKSAAPYVWGIAVHWYSGDDFPNLNTTHNLFPNKPILATEATEVRETDPANPSWSKGEHYAHDIIGDMNNWVVGFIDWNLILDMNGAPNHAGPDECEGVIKCGSDGMLLADTDNQIIYPQVFYYYVGHISKFVPRGSVRISSSVEGSALECIAFLTPESEVVVVAMNTGDSPITFKLLDIVAGQPEAVKVTALPHSIQTFVYT
ncbi:hypothetical protein EMCRGX_G032629 [Ephydatia muelleri]